MPRHELPKHPGSSERWWWGVTVPWEPPQLETLSGGRALLGGSHIHWASAVWQRFRSALLNAMWHVHQSKTKNSKRVSAKTHWHSPMPLTFTSSLSPPSCLCILPFAWAQSTVSFQANSKHCLRGPNAFRRSHSLAQANRHQPFPLGQLILTVKLVEPIIWKLSFRDLPNQSDWSFKYHILLDKGRDWKQTLRKHSNEFASGAGCLCRWQPNAEDLRWCLVSAESSPLLLMVPPSRIPCAPAFPHQW